ncbi:MAG TPA: methionine biosynthesis protein MetW [Thermodesulfobacteriota bacterium]|nr:methionine biosynthesis protein MetW [Thermodesulfobacteriota bacterium]
MNMAHGEIRLDHKVILGMVTDGASVLDLGCGEGELLSILEKEKKVRGQGIEFSEQAIYSCVEKGLSVYHGDIDTGLSEYGDGSFDYVILNESLQQVWKSGVVLNEALRVGRKVIVGFPNFGYYSVRLQVFFGGRTPVTPSLPYMWYDTPNVHFISISDFEEYCKNRGVSVLDSVFIRKNSVTRILPNLFADTGIFMISKTPSPP